MSVEERATRHPAHARVVFGGFTDGDDPMLLAWARFRDRVIGAAGLHEPALGVRVVRSGEHEHTEPRGVWRLLASNNRELGRSAHPFESFDSARLQVIRLRVDADLLETVAVHGPVAGTHGWVVLSDGAPVMTCGRWFGSDATATDAAKAAVETLCCAEVSDDAHLMTARGQRSRRSPEDSGGW